MDSAGPRPAASPADHGRRAVPDRAPRGGRAGRLLERPWALREGADEILEITRRQNEQLDEQCEAAGRDPSDLRRSLLLWDALDA